MKQLLVVNLKTPVAVFINPETVDSWMLARRWGDYMFIMVDGDKKVIITPETPNVEDFQRKVNRVFGKL